ncbi:MAG TPA: hypothetical protein PKD92_06045 [Novosphingobium sp.]|nr:hypothetical protein [Novosphingobium sp.]
MALFPLAAARADSSRAAPFPEPAVTYADLADLADSAPLVLRAQVRKLRAVEAARAPGLKPGFGRFLVTARPRALLWGPGLNAGDLNYLADIPLNARGKPPKLVRTEVMLFARPVANRPGELQLVAPDAQVPWGPRAEASLRAILTELAGAEPPPHVTGVREAIHVPGTLAGEGETQLFLSTREGTAAAITVNHLPGRQPTWTYSFSEVAGAGGQPPARETLAWYRLACFLPGELPRSADISDRPQDRARAQADWRLVMRDLGECPRLRNRNSGL